MRYWLDTFSTGYIDPKTNQLGITSAQSSLIVSILSAGTLFGSLFAAPIADWIGRRLAIMVSLCVFAFGVILQTVSVAIPLFVAGRFFAGMGVGMISMLETAPKWIRGAIVGAYQLAITIGLLFAAVIDNATKGLNNTGSYRIPIAVRTGLLFLPETPRYLIKRGRHDKAAKSLGRLRRLQVSDPHLIGELQEIEFNFVHEQTLVKGSSYLQFLKWHTLGKRLLTGCLLQALQQLTGINFIFYYGTSFFAASGIKQPFVTSMITSSVNVFSTLPGLYLVEAWGRHRLLLFGALGMFACQMIVGSVGTAFPNGDNLAAQKNPSWHSLEEVDELYEGVGKAWKSVHWVPTEGYGRKWKGNGNGNGNGDGNGLVEEDKVGSAEHREGGSLRK
ncbi:hypothetical protein DID88_008733 [Monilinia fructigena]|uniref:Major facilitator superfamily (MFS) profile domain-containing protein n=1 Tax=Monilinia fructigena TaxID=38457 RepID=A0A395JBA5_9HELO|nr:hypothetical protein DID88_008733 [Monilinia fructigena]